MSTLYFLLLIWILPALAKAGNTVDIEVFGSSQCGRTTRFLNRHLLKTWNLFGYSNRLNVKYHPLGHHEIQCKDTKCECGRNDIVCQLNLLQACVIEAKPKDYLQTIACVQGKPNLNVAITECVEKADKKLKLDAKSLRQCATSRANLLFATRYEWKPTYPWVEIAGEQNVNNIKARDNLWEELCKTYLKPQPNECKTKI